MLWSYARANSVKNEEGNKPKGTLKVKNDMRQYFNWLVPRFANKAVTLILQTYGSEEWMRWSYIVETGSTCTAMSRSVWTSCTELTIEPYPLKLSQFVLYSYVRAVTWYFVFATFKILFQSLAKHGKDRFAPVVFVNIDSFKKVKRIMNHILDRSVLDYNNAVFRLWWNSSLNT